MATVKGTYYSFYVPPAPVGSARDITPMYTETVTPGATGDIRQLLKIPINTCFGPGTFIQCSDMDTNGTPTVVMSLRITDGTTTKTLIDQTTIAQTGGLIRPSKIPATENAIGWVTDNVNYRLELVWVTGAATGVSGTLVYGLHMTGYAYTGIKS